MADEPESNPAAFLGTLSGRATTITGGALGAIAGALMNGVPYQVILWTTGGVCGLFLCGAWFCASWPTRAQVSLRAWYGKAAIAAIFPAASFVVVAFLASYATMGAGYEQHQSDRKRDKEFVALFNEGRFFEPRWDSVFASQSDGVALKRDVTAWKDRCEEAVDRWVSPTARIDFEASLGDWEGSAEEKPWNAQSRIASVRDALRSIMKRTSGYGTGYLN